MRVTFAQIAPKLGVSNIDLHLQIINEKRQESDLIIFPELSLHGYLLQDKVYEIAQTAKDIKSLIDASADVDIIFGMVYQDEKAIYNSALYLSEGSIRHLHHKNHLPNYGMFEEARYFFKGELLQSFPTKFGESMLIVCEDLWRAELIAKIAAIKPKNLYVIANSPARDFNEDELLIESQWDALLKSTALLANTTVVFVNRVGFEDGLGFWGGSRVVMSDAAVAHKLPLFENIIQTYDLKQKSFDAKRMIIKHG